MWPILDTSMASLLLHATIEVPRVEERFKNPAEDKCIYDGGYRIEK